jgi:UDP-GlcNAc:undecaprenyl-phosphate/decaprenyl-phosphate GlcNAc-1-phosphate transferase
MTPNYLIYFGNLVAFLSTVGFILLLRPLALRLNLVDEPGGRKQHIGKIPLIGGVAIFIGFCFALLTLPISLAPYRSFLGGAALLVIVGVLDDFHELSARSRFIAQIFAGLLMCIVGKNQLFHFGDLLYWGDIQLGILSIPVSVFATVGIINAVNMTDGINGLAGSLALIEMIFLAILAYSINDTTSVSLLTLFICALLGFLLFNWHWTAQFKFTVFMGDAGSMLLGFVLSWFLINLSQGEHAAVPPVTMLWIMAIPLLDTTWLLIKRSLQKSSPLAPGRDHLHHLLQDLGFSNLQITISLALAALILGLAGILGSIYHVQAGTMFLSFIALFIIYSYTVRYYWTRATGLETRN